MTRLLGSTAIALLIASTAQAGGIERNRLNDLILFEDGNYAEFGFTIQEPTVSGDYTAQLTAIGGGVSDTDNMAGGATYFSFGYKQDLTPGIGLALVLGQPYGADAEYSGGAYDGLSAKWSSTEARLLGSYEMQPGITAFGGLRVVQSQAEIAIPALLAGAASGLNPDGTGTGILGPYRNDEADAETDFGYVVGMAYERPEIALRVALTYESSVTHEFSTTERYNDAVTDSSNVQTVTPTVADTKTEVELPQAITLDFRSGIAENTLLFGSVRWVEWTAFEVRSPDYDDRTGDAFVEYDENTMTYELGLGYRLSEQLSVFGQVGFEDAQGGVASRLAPTDGYTSVSVGGSYSLDTVTIGGGVNYTMLGDAEDGSDVAFADNNVVGFGMNVGYSF